MAQADQPMPVRWVRAFTEWVGQGRKLTQTGRITLADARALLVLLGIDDEIDPRIGDRVFRTTSSDELPRLRLIVEWSKAAGLVRVVKGRLLQVKKNRTLLDRPVELADRMFEAFPKLGEVICPSGWGESPLREEFSPAMGAVLARLYGGPAQVAELCTLAWDVFTAPYVIEDAVEQHQRTWRLANDRDTRRALAVLEDLGAIKLTGEAVELTASGLRGVRRMLGEAQPGESVYQIKVTLLETADPVVWRRLLVAAGTPLDRLHRVVQAAMGWQNCHLHSFTADGAVYGRPDPELGFRDEKAVRLADVMAEEGSRIGYTYDFGDDWEHELTVEKVLAAREDLRYPICVDGRGACPPEDCGGVSGYDGLREVLADPAHPEHREMLAWMGLGEASEFDPHHFDAARVGFR